MIHGTGRKIIQMVTEMINLCSTGSRNQELQDDTAKKLCEYYDSIDK